MTLLNYKHQDSLLKIYKSAKRNAELSGWHGLGDVIYVGARHKVSNFLIAYLKYNDTQ